MRFNSLSSSSSCFFFFVWSWKLSMTTTNGKKAIGEARVTTHLCRPTRLFDRRWWTTRLKCSWALHFQCDEMASSCETTEKMQQFFFCFSSSVRFPFHSPKTQISQRPQNQFVMVNCFASHRFDLTLEQQRPATTSTSANKRKVMYLIVEWLHKQFSNFA